MRAAHYAVLTESYIRQGTAENLGRLQARTERQQSSLRAPRLQWVALSILVIDAVVGMGESMRRVPIERCRDFDEALNRVVRLPEPHLIVLDIEPGVAAWNADAGVRDLAISQLDERLSEAGHVVWFVSNGRFAVGVTRSVRVTTRARKPWTSLSRRPPDTDALPRLVIGDQVWTDGVLAYRMGARFILIDLPQQGVPVWPRWQRRLSWAPYLLFRRDRQGARGDSARSAT